MSDLIYDVGMNHGEDTAYYLSRGFRVVAIEANPALVSECTERFRDAIASGTLIIEAVGIAARCGEELFWINDEHDEFSALDVSVASRGGTARAVMVQCVTFGSLLRKHGVPYYLKIDIERADRYCLDSLSPPDLPPFISIEAHELDYLLVLWRLGYRQFKIVDQMRHNSAFGQFSNENPASRLAKYATWLADRINARMRPQIFPPGSSGPFGAETSGEWASIDEVAYNWLHLYYGHHRRGNLNRRSWFDFHAKR